MKIPVLILVLLAAFPLVGEMSIKEKVAFFEKKIAQSLSSEEKSASLIDLACAYIHDQEVNKAFSAFLEALKCAPEQKNAALLEEEKKIYDSALSQYLKQGCIDPFKTARELLSTYEELALAHPEYCHLNFLIATAYGNVGRYEEFFKLFAKLYPQMQDNFLADKSVAMLYFKKAQTENNESLKAKAIEHLKSALAKTAIDPTIYKLLIIDAKEKGQHDLEVEYFKMMCAQKAPLMRGDIFLYVKELVDLKQIEIAEGLLKNAAAEYSFSRSIVDAQSYITKAKN